MSLIEEIAEAKTMTELYKKLTGFLISKERLEEPLLKGEVAPILRGFYWYSHVPFFDDVYDSTLAAMPVLAGYASHLIARGEAADSFSVRRVKRAGEMLAEYLDEAALSLSEDEEATDIVYRAVHAAEGSVPRMKTILTADPRVAEREKKLATLAKRRPGLRKALQRSPGARIKALKACFSDIHGAKNRAYQLVRLRGADVIPELEKHIYKLHPADQDYLLHGLDAFPKNQKVLLFFKRFVAKSKSPRMIAQAKKYADRVRRGVRTTGYET